jgi:hypothetical protein
MDIDFHYFATYVASRFAGYSKDQSKIISSSAQMIDENARHNLLGKPGDTTGVRGVPDDFEIRMNVVVLLSGTLLTHVLGMESMLTTKVYRLLPYSLNETFA